MAPHLAGQREAQELRALHLDAVVVLGKVGLTDASRRAGLREIARQLPDGLWINAAEGARFLRLVLLQMLAQLRDRVHPKLALTGIDLGQLAF